MRIHPTAVCSFPSPIPCRCPGRQKGCPPAVPRQPPAARLSRGPTAAAGLAVPGTVRRWRCGSGCVGLLHRDRHGPARYGRFPKLPGKCRPQCRSSWSGYIPLSRGSNGPSGISAGCPHRGSVCGHRGSGNATHRTGWGSRGVRLSRPVVRLYTPLFPNGSVPGAARCVFLSTMQAPPLHAGTRPVPGIRISGSGDPRSGHCSSRLFPPRRSIRAVRWFLPVCPDTVPNPVFSQSLTGPVGNARCPTGPSVVGWHLRTGGRADSSPSKRGVCFS